MITNKMTKDMYIRIIEQGFKESLFDTSRQMLAQLIEDYEDEIKGLKWNLQDTYPKDDLAAELEHERFYAPFKCFLCGEPVDMKFWAKGDVCGQECLDILTKQAEGA